VAAAVGFDLLTGLAAIGSRELAAETPPGGEFLPALGLGAVAVGAWLPCTRVTADELIGVESLAISSPFRTQKKKRQILLFQGSFLVKKARAIARPDLALTSIQELTIGY